MKKLFLSLALLFPILLNANPVDQQTAARVAFNFWNAHHDKGMAELTAPMTLVNTPQWDAFFIFRPADRRGFVIVAADDCVEPVLAYSFENNPSRGDSIGPQMAWWLDGWQQQIAWCRSRRIAQSAELSNRWDHLVQGSEAPRPLNAMAPMITTKWDQEEPYNDSCPSSGSGWYASRAATGCVATAMAQVMKYWEYPATGFDTHSYYSYSISGYGSGFGTQFANFGNTSYDWRNMPDTLDYYSSDAEIAAVATLMYHCGVASDMIYGSAWEGGSGAFIHNIPLLCYGHTLNGMINYFGYSNRARGMDRIRFDDSTWTAMVRAELDARRPIIYAGGDAASGGHCFVCHAYDDDNRFCFNWGWSGTGDGYYLLSHLAPGMGGTGGGTGTYDFTNLQQMLIGVQPPANDDDMFCFIREFPYYQTFDEAATGWSATTTSDQTYSWSIYDTTGIVGNYSAVVMAPYSGTSQDHMFSPYIVKPGTYSLAWQTRRFKTNSPAGYTLTIDTLSFADTITNDLWNNRSLQFSVAEGDTVRLDFYWTGARTTNGIIIDSISISRLHTEGISTAQETTVSVYPNPTDGLLTISSSQPLQHIELLDISGRQLLTTKDNSLDLSSFPNGIYLLRCTTPSGSTIQKIIKK